MSARAWAGNERWPSGRNMGEFARDVFRLEGCKSDRDKAMAFYKWLIRCFMRGPNYDVPSGFGGYSRTFDVLPMFTSFGCFECTGWGWIAAEALCAAGMKARRIVGQNDGHTIYEVWYKGEDGRESWHAFDAHQGWWFQNRAGSVASCEELTADPQLVHDPIAHAVPLAYNRDMSYLGKRHDWGDALDIVQELQNETLAYELKPGMEYANLFAPADPSQVLYCGAEYPFGAHCHIPEYDTTGAVLYPQHEPYWHNYRFRFQDDGWYGSRNPARSHGAGALRWMPLLQGAAAADYAHHAVFENNTLRPAGVSKFCEVWYRIRLPYYASYLKVEGFLRGGWSDYFGIAISPDRRVVTPLWTNLRGGFRHQNGLEERKNNKPSVQYLRDFYLRLDMHGHSAVLPRLESLRLVVGYQHNMFTQPFLLPGGNKLFIEGADTGADRISARWNYTICGREETQELSLDGGTRVEKTVELKAERPQDITMRGLVVNCSNISC